MMTQWPSERVFAQHDSDTSIDKSIKSKEDFLDLFRTSRTIDKVDYQEISARIIKLKTTDLDELDRLINLAPNPVDISDHSQSHTMALTAACAMALAQEPTIDTWIKVNFVKGKSWAIDHWLGEAMLAYVEINPSAGTRYINLTKKMLRHLDDFTLKSNSKSNDAEREGAWRHWNETEDKLEEIWWGLRGFDFISNYESEIHIFKVFSKLSISEYITTITHLNNPYLLRSTLFPLGVYSFRPNFSNWKKLLAASPVTFTSDGAWNGSVLLPLLFNEARNQLLFTPKPDRYPEPTKDELEAVKFDIKNATESIVNALAKRIDFVGSIVRWTPWLMRQIIRSNEKEIPDPMSSAYADDMLLEEIGRKLEGVNLPQHSPDEAPSWEAWCYLCALASLSHSQYLPLPDWKKFQDEWNISAEDWAGQKGTILRERAKLITQATKETPGIAANLLAYLIANSSSPVEGWTALWHHSFVLREILEFGDSDAIESDYSSRSEAGRLLHLLLRIGLAIFDQCADRIYDCNSPAARALVVLFAAIHRAICDIREIDTTLTSSEWVLLLQHLAIRRMLWERHADITDSSPRVQVFNTEDYPTMSSFLVDSKSNAVELIDLLQSLLLNCNITKMRAIIKSASIDLPNAIRSLEALNMAHPRKYPISKRQLQELQRCSRAG